MSEYMNTASGILYNAVTYSRLSDDDVDKSGKRESDSIVNQKEYIREFLKSIPEIRICSERADDGFSGVDFFRPDFQRMMEDIRAGAINCVVVKDLSRLGRNYIDTGKYLQEFARLGVRFIAINDGYICCSSYGRPRSATYASSQYKALLRNNGLPDIRFHDLRHTYASMLLSEELSVKAVSNTLGHAKSIVTVDVYGDKARIIGDGTDAMRPTLEYVLPTEYITSREVGVLKKRVVYDSSIGFPEELADDIMECLLHKCA